MSAALELSGIDKRFGPVRALTGAGIRVERGTVHAVVGENGAGKSTLMKIAYGHLRADAGTIAIKGQPIERARHGPRVALDRGVGMVHQHFMLVPTLTVAENLMLGREPTRGPALDLGRATREIQELADRIGMPVEPGARVEALSVGERQRVEILRVLHHGADVLILDEPTAVLTPAEVRELFAILRGLVDAGTTVVLVTHKLDEVIALADQVTVLRRGENAGELSAGELSAEAIARAMVGRPVLLEVDRTPASPGEVVLRARGATARGDGGRRGIDGASFEVRAGEVVGIAGVQGNGQSELVEAIAGLRHLDSGAIELGGEALGGSVRARGEAGVGHVPEDRHDRGLVLELSVADNLILGQQRAFASRGLLDRSRIARRAADLIADYDVRPDDPAAIAGGLSGGNQQKLVVGRELARPGLRLLLCAQPTRGVDIGAIELIHRRILAARDAGVAVLLVSAELSELAALADRVLVAYRGQIVHEAPGAELADQAGLEAIGAYMTGARGEGA